MMRIFNGKKIAEKILLDLGKRIKKEKLKLKLAVISIGEDPASKLFIRNKKLAAKKVGIKVSQYRFKEPLRQIQGKNREKEIIQKIRKLNADPSVNGIIVQLPLPKGFNTNKIIKQVSPRKDVDGFGKMSAFPPVLPSAILIALKWAIKRPRNKKIIALVNSDIFGRILKLFLNKKGIKIDYSKDRKSPKIKEGDIIITVLGAPQLIKGEMVKDGAILIDAGITVIGRNKVVGDIDRESVAQKACFLTPVPGGIGPLTVALLLKNVYFSSR